MVREIAWRLFSRELSEIKFIERKGEEKETRYGITRLGAKVNRVIGAGIVESKNVGNGVVFSTVNDGTGIFNLKIYKQFSDPEVYSFIENMEPPLRVIFVGKLLEEASGYSLRIENMRECDEKIENYWKYRAIENLLYRAEIMEKAIEYKDFSTLEKEGYPHYYIENAQLSLQYFPDTEISHIQEYRNMVRKFFVNEEKKEKSVEDIILELIEKLDFEGGGAKYDDIVEKASDEGIERTVVDEILNNLQDRGIIYEPTINRFKKL